MHAFLLLVKTRHYCVVCSFYAVSCAEEHSPIIACLTVIWGDSSSRRKTHQFYEGRKGSLASWCRRHKQFHFEKSESTSHRWKWSVLYSGNLKESHYFFLVEIILKRWFVHLVDSYYGFCMKNSKTDNYKVSFVGILRRWVPTPTPRKYGWRLLFMAPIS